jgi:hypothetical protein
MKIRNLLLTSFLFCLCVIGRLGAAPTVWTGTLTNFTKLDFANPTLAATQDRLSANVWLTRGSSQGLYNAKTESFFTHFLSPSGTQWANGSLANYASLAYTDWNTWAKGVNAGPSSTVGVNAVLHLVADDVYLSIKFTSWNSGGAGGGFSYQRSTPTVVPEPSTVMFLALGTSVVFAHRRARRG